MKKIIKDITPKMNIPTKVFRLSFLLMIGFSLLSTIAYADPIIGGNTTACQNTPGNMYTFVNGGSCYSYSWSLGDGGSSSSSTNSNQVSVNWTTGGTKTMTCSCRDLNGNTTSSASKTVVVSPSNSVSASVFPGFVSLGQSVTLSASGVSSFKWSGSGLSSSTGAQVTATPAAFGTNTYYVTEATTPSGNCVAGSSVTVIAGNLPDKSFCKNGGTINLNTEWAMTGGTWKLDNNTVANTLNLGSLAVGLHTVKFTANGYTDDMNLTITETVVGGITPSSSTVCIGANVTLTASGTGSVKKWEKYEDGSWIDVTVNGQLVEGNPLSYQVNTQNPLEFRATFQNGACATELTPAGQYAKVTPVTLPVGTTISSTGIVTSCTLVKGSIILKDTQNATITEVVDSWSKSYDGATFPGSIPNSNSATLSDISETRRVWFKPSISKQGCVIEIAPIVLEPSGPVAGHLGSDDFIRSCGSASGKLKLDNSSGTISWQKSRDQITWEPVGGTESSIPMQNYIDGSVMLATHYQAIVSQNSCPSVTSNIFSSYVSTQGGAAISAVASYCNLATGTIDVSSDAVGLIQRWEYAEGETDNWIVIAGSSGAKPLSYSTSSTRRYRALLQFDSCPEKYSSPVTITVNSNTVPGIVRLRSETSEVVNGVLTFYPVFELTNAGGQIQNWWKYENGNASSVSNTTSILSAGPITTTTSYSVQVKSGSCDALESGKAIFVVNAPAMGIQTVVDEKNLVAYLGNSYQVKTDKGVKLKSGFLFFANSSQDFFVLLDDEASVPPAEVNVVLEETILQPNLTEDQIYFANASQRQSMYTYLDALGRPVQQVQRKISPTEKDVVVPVTYDSRGRKNKEYLPYVAANGDGLYKKTAVMDQFAFYAPSVTDIVHGKIASSDFPYSEIVYEASPLNRIKEQSAPGLDWKLNAGHTTKNNYGTNTGGEAIVWKLDPLTGMPLNNGAFVPGELLVRETIDENAHGVREYVTKRGQTILKKVQDASQWNETYYIYDDFDLLRFVIQPEGVAQLSGNPDPVFLDKWAFQYKYDERKRMIEKRVPGAGWIYMVYDKKDRLVLSQDGVQRVHNQWSFIKYDILNRQLLTGIYTPSSVSSRSDMQILVTGPSDESYNGTASFYGYTNAAFPATSLEVLTVAYYDNYSFLNLLGAGFSYDPNALEGIPSTNFAMLKGISIGTQIRVIGTDTWIKGATYYDDRYRIIQTISTNHLGGKDRSSTKYDFAGKVMSRLVKHEQGEVTTILEAFTYDHAGRIIAQTHKVNNGTSVLLKSPKYNELGQLVEKNLHLQQDGTFAQSVDYRYTIRGWLSSINNATLTDDGDMTNDESNDWFGMELKYNNPGALNGTAQYNGNISEIAWKGVGQSQQGYGFEYDAINRLIQAVYKDIDLPVRNGLYNETIGGYDKNGNILALQRAGRIAENVYGSIDNLAYSYVGNQLTSVTETNGNTTKGFIDGNISGNDYGYDANGNMSMDKNKEIVSITYNHLNLPDWITKTNGDRIKYTYSAAGTKLIQQVYKGNATTPEKVSDYLGSFFMENGVLQFINHDEGRVVMKGSIAEYQYFLKDHLGNVRTTFTTLEAVETSQATNEENNATEEQGYYLNYGKGRYVNSIIYDHTYDGNLSPPASVRALRLTGGGDKDKIGLARSLSVMPGDKINIEVFAKYYEAVQGDNSGFAQLMLSIVSGIGIPANTIIDGIAYSNGANTSLPFTALSKDDIDPLAPKAFLNWLVFDKDDQIDLARSGFKQITTNSRENGTNVAHDRLAPDEEIEIKESGLVYIWLSNENSSSVEVYFDDFTVTHTKSPIVQQDDYYPFGLVSRSSNRENSTKNNHLYNGKELQDELDLGWMDYGARMYFPEIGRWGVIDPLSSTMEGFSNYGYAYNNPVSLVDIMGLSPVYNWEKERYEDNGKEISFDEAMASVSTGQNNVLVVRAWDLNVNNTDNAIRYMYRAAFATGSYTIFVGGKEDELIENMQSYVDKHGKIDNLIIGNHSSYDDPFMFLGESAYMGSDLEAVRSSTALTKISSMLNPDATVFLNACYVARPGGGGTEFLKEIALKLKATVIGSQGPGINSVRMFDGDFMQKSKGFTADYRRNNPQVDQLNGKFTKVTLHNGEPRVTTVYDLRYTKSGATYSEEKSNQ